MSYNYLQLVIINTLYESGFRRLQSTSASIKATTAFPSAKTFLPPADSSNKASKPLVTKRNRICGAILDEPIAIVQHAGSRILMLKYPPQKDSLLSSAQLQTLQKKIFNYEENHIIGAYFVCKNPINYFLSSATNRNKTIIFTILMFI